MNSGASAPAAAPVDETGLRFYYRSRGVPDAPGLVFLHAFPLNSSMWEEGLARFSETHFCVAPDFPGFGAEGRSAAGPVFLEHYVDAFEALLRSFPSPRQWIWCGVSMGGYVALRALERFPELCRGLVLCDTKSAADDDTGRLKRAKALRSLQSGGLEAFADAQFEALVGRSARASAELRSRFREMTLLNSPEGVAAGIVALATRTDTSSSLPKIDVPSLIVVGEEDTVTPPAEARRLQDAIRRSRLSIMSGTGHLPPLEAAEPFYGQLADFLRELG